MTNEAIERFAAQVSRLRRPVGIADIVLDTDTFNEIDDQFALSYMVLSPEKLRVRGICAAPFHNDNSDGPADGMEKSYREILKLLGLLGREDLTPLVQRGSDRFLPSETEPVDSDAARTLVELSRAYTAENPLYIAAIGAITNVASALLLDPTVAERVYIIWLGANGFDFGSTAEFNLMQDVAAGRVVLRSGAPVVLFPAMGTTSHLQVSEPELEAALRGKNALCDYLLENTVSYMRRWHLRRWHKVIWDIAAIGWFLDETFQKERIIHAPIPQYDHHFSEDGDGVFLRYVYSLDADRVLDSLFTKLESFSEGGEK